MENKYIICKTDSDGNETYFSEFIGTGGENSEVKPYFCTLLFKKVRYDICYRCSEYNGILMFNELDKVKEFSKLIKEKFYKKDNETTISIVCVNDLGGVELSKLGTLLVIE